MAARRPQHNGRVTTSPAPSLSRETLEFCDWLIDGVTVAANHPDFEAEAARVGRAKREVAEALAAAGGIPLGAQRAAAAAT